MILRPPTSQRTYTLFPYTTLFRSKFRNLLAYPDKNLVCGEINGKNSFGAYSGFIDFYYDNGFAMIADHDSIFRSRLDELCMGAMKDQGDAALKRALAIWDEMPDSEEKAKAIAEIEKLESRSEERRVGKEGVRTCRTRWSPDHENKKRR